LFLIHKRKISYVYIVEMYYNNLIKASYYLYTRYNYIILTDVQKGFTAEIINLILLEIQFYYFQYRFD